MPEPHVILSDRYIIQSRNGLNFPKYRIVKVTADGTRLGIGTFWTLRGAHRWLNKGWWVDVTPAVLPTPLAQPPAVDARTTTQEKP